MGWMAATLHAGGRKLQMKEVR